MSGDVTPSNQRHGSVRIPVVASFDEPPLAVIPQGFADPASNFSIGSSQPVLPPTAGTGFAHPLYKAVFEDWASRGLVPSLQNFEKRAYPFQVRKESSL